MISESVVGSCKSITSPVLQHETHAQGLLHELAEEEKITYIKENEK